MNFSPKPPPDPGRITMVVYNDFSNDARVLKEAQTLEKNGYFVDIIAFRGEGLPDSEQISTGISVVRISRSLPLISGLYKTLAFKVLYPLAHGINRSSGKIVHFLLKIPEYFFIILRTIFLLLRFKNDIIHSHDLNTLLPCWIAAKIKRLPIVYDAHEINFDREGYSQFKFILRPLESFLIRRVDAVITTTNMRAKVLADAFAIETPAVIQNRPRYIEPRKSNLIRQKLSLKEDWPIVLYQGGISQGRGMRNLVRVCCQIPNAYFVCIGSGKQDSELDELIIKEKLEKRFFRISKVPLAELHALTCSATVGIQPLRNTCLNHYTTDSNKLFEYIMAGLPVAASRFPEIESVVSDYGVGELFDPDNLDQIVQALKSVLFSDKAEIFRSNALKSSKELTWESQEEVLIKNVYGNLTRT